MSQTLRRWSRPATAFSLALALVLGLAPAAGAGDDQGAPAYYDSGLAARPYMGWNTYYGLGAPTEDAVKDVADHLVESGLRDSG